MAEMDDLDGKAALVTGASAGVGRATATELAREGADVALVARGEDRLVDLAEELEAAFDADTAVLPADVSDPARVDRAVEDAVEAFGGLDVVVSNAAVGQSAPIDEITVEEYRTVTGVNIDGMYFVARGVLPHLRASRGSLVFIGSTAGQHPEPMHPLYAATKWWTRGFAQNLAGYAGEDGVAVAVVNPTAIRTEFGSAYREPNRDVYEAGSVLEPEDVAHAVVFAAKQEAPVTVGELDLLRRNEFSGVDRFD